MELNRLVGISILVLLIMVVQLMMTSQQVTASSVTATSTVIMTGNGPLSKITNQQELSSGSISRVAQTKRAKRIPKVAPWECRPRAGLNQQKCKRLINGCPAIGIRMKFMQSNCVNPDGTRMRDAGCQCGRYCAYGCKRICNSDPDCIWSHLSNKCFIKGTQQPGFAIDDCAHPPLKQNTCQISTREENCGGDHYCAGVDTCFQGQSSGMDGVCFRQFENNSTGVCGENLVCDEALTCQTTSACPANHVCVETCCDLTFATGKCARVCDKEFL